jgi:hypothetical protein
MRERGSGSWELDALERKDLGELVEVRVAVEYRNAAVLGGGCGNQRVGGRHTVVSVAALGQLADRAHRGVGHGAIVAQDPQRTELGLERNVLG